VGDTSKMSLDKMQAALASVVAMEQVARLRWNEFVATVSRRPNKMQAERIAFLRGRLSGLHEAHREFEMRAPMEFHGSELSEPKQ
jgi:hypothetical protein